MKMKNNKMLFNLRNWFKFEPLICNSVELPQTLLRAAVASNFTGGGNFVIAARVNAAVSFINQKSRCISFGFNVP